MTDEATDTERDTETFSMFGDAEVESTSDDAYQVLARKYRPRLFSDMIGQEAMVRTLRNAFETGRIAHAFMLTGVRGVGKTTTARLLARALNYSRDGEDKPSLELDPPGEHCAAIMAGNHPDVLELDAASRTGVADMRDLLDGVRYAPSSARYKVYIIDEVHMLSTQSFNALLKTLEEPPPHVKFIFATTEIRKVPVTVLSRCQRFDLKRMDTLALADHLSRIAQAEGANVSNEGLTLIARAAEGSVRDGLSILDQAIVQAIDGGEITGTVVRDMLGLGDRLRLLDTFEYAIDGKADAALSEIGEQVHAGADPLVLLKDLLEIAADIATVQAASDAYELPGPADWTERTRALAKRISAAQAQRYWQILLSGYRDTQTAPEAETALKMVVLRIISAANLPSPEEAAQLILKGGASGAAGKPETNDKAAPKTGIPVDFAAIVDLLAREKELLLWGEVRQYLRVESYAPGHLVCAVETGAPVDLLRRLSATLERMTGIEWNIEQAETNNETDKERAARLHEEKLAEARALPDVARALSALPGAEIIDVTDSEDLEAGQGADNVITLPTQKRGTSE